MKKVKNLDLRIILVCFTLAAVIVAIILIVKPGQVKKLDDVKTVTISDYKSKGASKYFIFVYNEDKDKEKSQFEEVYNEIINYAEYSRTHKKAPKIYLLNVKDNTGIYDDFKTEKISITSNNSSCLITVENGKYTVTTDVGKICNLLIDYETGKN